MADHDPEFEQFAQPAAPTASEDCAVDEQWDEPGVQDLNAPPTPVTDEAPLDDPPNRFEALRTLLERGGDCLDAEEKREIAHELATLHAAKEEWAEVAQLRAIELENTDDPESRRALFLSLASTLSRDLDDAEQAIDVLLLGLRELLDDAAIARELDALARWEGAWGKLVATARGWVDDEQIANDAGLQVEVLRHLARWYGALGQTTWAIDCLEQARALKPWNVAPYLPLAAALEDAGRRADARAVLEDALHRAVEKSDRKEVAFALGTFLATDESELAIAAKHLRITLEIEPGHVGALRALSAIQPKIQAWAQQLDVLEALLEKVDDDGERARLLRAIADVREKHFLDFDGASRRLEESLEIDPTDDDAYAAVARCYAKLRLWDAAVHAHERHVDATQDDARRVEAYAAMGRICDVELAATERAIEAYRAALEIDPMHARSLEALARAYERTGEISSAVELLRRLADVTTDVAQKVALLVRVGAASEEKLFDREAARHAYHAAMDADPTCISAISALRRLRAEEGAWEDVATLLDREQRQTTAPRARAKLLVELATVRRDRLDDERGAMHAFEEAHALDPEREDAAWAVVGASFDRHDFAAVEPILTRLSHTAHKRDRAERARIFAMLGRALEELGKPKRAMQAYAKALEAAPTDADARRGLAECAWIVGDFPAALVAHQKLLATIVEEDDPLRAQTLYRIGAIHRSLGDARKAITFLQRAIEADERHRPALQSLVELHTTRGAHRDAIDALRRMIDVEDDLAARCALLVDVAERWRERLNEPLRALEALSEAVELRPEDRTLLHRLLQHQEAAKEWDGVCATIDRIVALDSDGPRMAKYLCTAATIRRDHCDDVAGAVERFDRALDADPKQLSAFTAIEEMLGRRGDWRALENAYRRMISRVSVDAPIAARESGVRAREASDAKVEHALWHALGRLLRERIGDGPGSVEAFRRAAELDPDDSQQRRALAQALQATDRTDLALAELDRARESDPMHVPTLRALHELCVRARMVDRAWCVREALVFCEGAERLRHSGAHELRTTALPGFRAALDETTWTRFVAHPMQHADVDAVLAAIALHARALRLDALRARRSLPPPATMTKQDPTTTDFLPSRVFFGLARVLGMTSAELYLCRDAVAPIGLGPSVAFSTVLAPAHLVDRSIAELAFVIGEHLVLHRPEQLVRATFPALSELGALVGSAIALGKGEDDDGARRLRASMTQERVVVVCNAVRRMGGAAPDVQRWMHGASLTALRLGAVLCGDVGSAAKIVKTQQVVPGAPTTSERMRELVRWFASGDHCEVRAALGIAHRARTDDDDDEPTLDRRLCA